MGRQAEDFARRLLGQFGVKDKDAEFFGAFFGALIDDNGEPEPAPPRWLRALGLEPQLLAQSPAEVLRCCEKRYRELVRKHHPDRPGGSAEAMAEINVAIADARSWFAGVRPGAASKP